MLALKTIFFSGTLAGVAYGLTLQGTPRQSTVLYDRVKSWSGDAQNAPDGKFWSLKKDPSNSNSGFIIDLSPNNFINANGPYVDNITTPYNSPSEQTETSNGNSVTNPPTLPIPSASQTGMRADGTKYDENSLWIMSAFRYSDTSQPGANQNKLIGMEHNEDYYKDAGGGSCTYKSIAIRYSNDLSKSWTRSVPILTKGIQTQNCDPNHQFTGTGDFAAMWNSVKQEWNIFAQEGPLVMSRSKDPNAAPGTWTRIDPVSGRTQPGFIGSTDGSTLAHGDLASVPGSNPSIIFDKVTNLYHMVWGKWGGGIAYANSKDMYRWTKPVMIWTDESAGGLIPGSTYPTLIGSEGDTLTTTGGAILTFGGKAASSTGWGRSLWQVPVTFSIPAAS